MVIEYVMQAGYARGCAKKGPRIGAIRLNWGPGTRCPTLMSLTGSATRPIIEGVQGGAPWIRPGMCLLTCTQQRRMEWKSLTGALGIDYGSPCPALTNPNFGPVRGLIHRAGFCGRRVGQSAVCLGTSIEPLWGTNIPTILLNILPYDPIEFLQTGLGRMLVLADRCR